MAAMLPPIMGLGAGAWCSPPITGARSIADMVIPGERRRALQVIPALVRVDGTITDKADGADCFRERRAALTHTKLLIDGILNYSTNGRSATSRMEPTPCRRSLAKTFAVDSANAQSERPNMP